MRLLSTTKASGNDIRPLDKETCRKAELADISTVRNYQLNQQGLDAISPYKDKA